MVQPGEETDPVFSSAGFLFPRKEASKKMGHKNHAVFCQQDEYARGRKSVISLVINNRKTLQLNIEQLNIVYSDSLEARAKDSSIVRG